MKLLFLCAAFLWAVVPHLSGQETKAQTIEKPAAPPANRFDPVLRDIEGWKVHVEPSLIDGAHREEGAKALTMLANHLQRIKILVPAGPLAQLQTIEIWIGTISTPSSAPN